MTNTFEDLKIDNSAITALELLELARKTQLKIASRASTLYFKNENATFKKFMDIESRKLDYIEYLIRQLKEEKKK